MKFPLPFTGSGPLRRTSADSDLHLAMEGLTAMTAPTDGMVAPVAIPFADLAGRGDFWSLAFYPGSELSSEHRAINGWIPPIPNLFLFEGTACRGRAPLVALATLIARRGGVRLQRREPGGRIVIEEPLTQDADDEMIGRFVDTRWWDPASASVRVEAQTIVLPVRAGDSLVGAASGEHILRIGFLADGPAFGTSTASADTYLLDAREYLQRFSDGGVFEDTPPLPLAAREDAASRTEFAQAFIIKQTASTTTSRGEVTLLGGIQNVQLELGPGGHVIPESLFLVSPTSSETPASDRVMVIESGTSRAWTMRTESGTDGTALGEGTHVELTWGDIQPPADGGATVFTRELVAGSINIRVPHVHNAVAQLRHEIDVIEGLLTEELTALRQPVVSGGSATLAEVEVLRHVLAQLMALDPDGRVRFHGHDLSMQVELTRALRPLTRDSRLTNIDTRRAAAGERIRAIFRAPWFPGQLDASGDAGNVTMTWLVTLLRTMPSGASVLAALDSAALAPFITRRINEGNNGFRAAIALITANAMTRVQRHTELSGMSVPALFNELFGTTINSVIAVAETAADGGDPPRGPVPTRVIVEPRWEGARFEFSLVHSTRPVELSQLALRSIEMVYAACNLVHNLHARITGPPSETTGQDILSDWEHVATLISSATEFYRALGQVRVVQLPLLSASEEIIEATSRQMIAEAALPASMVIGTVFAIIAAGLEMAQLLDQARDLERRGDHNAAACAYVAMIGVGLGLFAIPLIECPPLALAVIAISTLITFAGYIGMVAATDTETPEQQAARREYETLLDKLRVCYFGTESTPPHARDIAREIADVYSFLVPIRGTFQTDPGSLYIQTRYLPPSGGRVWLAAHDDDGARIYEVSFNLADARTGLRFDAHREVALAAGKIMIRDPSLPLDDTERVFIVMSLSDQRVPAPTDPRIRDALEARFQNEAFTTRAVLLRHDSLFSADDWRHLLAAF